MEKVISFVVEHYATIAPIVLFILSELIGKSSSKYNSLFELVAAFLRARSKDDVKEAAKDALGVGMDKLEKEAGEEIDRAIDKADEKLDS